MRPRSEHPVQQAAGVQREIGGGQLIEAAHPAIGQRAARQHHAGRALRRADPRRQNHRRIQRRFAAQRGDQARRVGQPRRKPPGDAAPAPRLDLAHQMRVGHARRDADLCDRAVDFRLAPVDFVHRIARAPQRQVGAAPARVPAPPDMVHGLRRRGGAVPHPPLEAGDMIGRATVAERGAADGVEIVVLGVIGRGLAPQRARPGDAELEDMLAQRLQRHAPRLALARRQPEGRARRRLMRRRAAVGDKARDPRRLHRRLARQHPRPRQRLRRVEAGVHRAVLVNQGDCQGAAVDHDAIPRKTQSGRRTDRPRAVVSSPSIISRTFLPDDDTVRRARADRYPTLIA